MTELRSKIERVINNQVEVTFGSDDITVLIERAGMKMSVTTLIDRRLNEVNTVFSQLPSDNELVLDCFTMKQLMALKQLIDDAEIVAGLIEAYLESN